MICDSFVEVKEKHAPLSRDFADMEALIRESWERSRSFGVDPDLDGAPETSRLTEKALQERIGSQRQFYESARAQLDSLYRLLRGTGFCMAFTEGEGYVLYIVGDEALTEHFKRRRCVPGYRWTERDLGTCAIGLALAARRPVFIPGEYMYGTKVRSISNAGAPIFSPDGSRILGVVSLSGPSDKMHIHTLGLVRQAAETVTSQLREQERFRDVQIKNQYLRALVESDPRGIVTVDRQGTIVEVNSSARRLLRLPVECQGRRLEEFLDKSDLAACLDTGREDSDREVLVRRSGTSCYMSFASIHLDDGELVGGLITLMERKKMMRMAVQMVGAQAHFTFASILGTSRNLQEALRLARIAAGSAAPVLLYGETGTGKELFAQSIHNAGSRSTRPFVVINCGAIPKELLESELFGYEEGSFTGAQKGGRPGKIELADTGTLFLDEIGDMPLDMQVKLLRVLQSGEIQRVGGLRTIPVDFRIIAATNRNLRTDMEQHRFRADLYYRISTLTIVVPPLRDRGQDVLQLAEYFVRRYERQLGRSIWPVPEETMNALLRYPWPGNIRQLENSVERAVHFSEGSPLLPSHFGIPDLVNPKGAREEEQDFASLEHLERTHIARVMEQFGSNLSRVAAVLGISRPTLYRKLRQYGLR